MIFFDTTSTYFETDPDEENDEEGDESGLRRLGHSKDHRPDLPQVVIGLAVTREGIPVRVWVWPGNSNDQTLVEQVKTDLAGWRLGRAIYVVDSGFSSQSNLRRLRTGGGHYIAGIKLRSGMPETEQALSRQGRYRTVRDNLRVKEVKVGDGDAAVRYVVCHNPAEAERDQARRQQQLDRIETELARLAKQRQSAKTKTERDQHLRGECALRDHPTLSRYLRQRLRTNCLWLSRRRRPSLRSHEPFHRRAHRRDRSVVAGREGRASPFRGYRVPSGPARARPSPWRPHRRPAVSPPRA